MLEKKDILQILSEHIGQHVDDTMLQKTADALYEAMTAEWEPVHIRDEEMGYTISNELIDVCMIDRLLNEGYEVRIFKSKKPVHEKGYLDKKYQEYLTK